MEKKKAILKIESYSSKDGMLLLSVSDFGVRAMLKGLVELCVNKYGGYVKIEASPPYKPRTTGKYSQNHLLNGNIMQICNETGNDYDTVKIAIKMIAVEQLDYPYKTLGGKIIPIGEHESSTVECSKLIEASFMLAADLGIILQGSEG